MGDVFPSRRILKVRTATCIVALFLLLNGHVAFGQSAASSPGIVSRIKRVAVQSTALATIGYSKRLHALEVEFLNGAIYRYLDVPPEIHREMMAAESKARFYHKHVRGQYRSVHVRPRRKR